MLIAFFLAALTTFSTAQTSESARTAVLASVHGFVDSFNKGDIKMMLATCADQTSILDEFPPHEWHGKGACAEWASDFEADARKNGITDGAVTLGNPSHVDITSDRAYVVIPADYSFQQKGNRLAKLARSLRLLCKEARRVGESRDGRGRSIRRCKQIAPPRFISSTPQASS
jgi:hypothetical protein